MSYANYVAIRTCREKMYAFISFLIQKGSNFLLFSGMAALYSYTGEFANGINLRGWSYCMKLPIIISAVVALTIKLLCRRRSSEVKFSVRRDERKVRRDGRKVRLFALRGSAISSWVRNITSCTFSADSGISSNNTLHLCIFCSW
jgi:hypothetical protein